MKFILILIKDWFIFLFHPRDLFPVLSTKKKLLSFIFYLFFLGVVSSTLMTFNIYLFSKLFQWHVIPYPLLTKFSRFPPFWNVVLIAPILEELICRLSLRFKPLYLAITISVLLFFIIAFYILKVHPFCNTRYILVNTGIIVAVSVLFYFLVKVFKESFEKFWTRYLRIIFYSFAIFFGFMHLGNFCINHYSILLLSPLFIFPYIFIGLNLGFIRLKYGIVFSIFLHGFYNSLPFIFMLV
jgi:hypothetical protein